MKCPFAVGVASSDDGFHTVIRYGRGETTCPIATTEQEAEDFAKLVMEIHEHLDHGGCKPDVSDELVLMVGELIEIAKRRDGPLQ